MCSPLGFHLQAVGWNSPLPPWSEKVHLPEFGTLRACLRLVWARVACIMMSLPNIGSALTFIFFSGRQILSRNLAAIDAAHNDHSTSQRKLRSIWVFGMPERKRTTWVGKAFTQSVTHQPVIGPAERESPVRVTQFRTICICEASVDWDRRYTFHGV